MTRPCNTPINFVGNKMLFTSKFFGARLHTAFLLSVRE